MQSIRLNGEQYSSTDIHSAIASAEFILLPEWKRKIFHFLKNWWDSTDHISQHTSGSTGPPKRIQLPKVAMAASAKRTCSYFELTKEDTALLCLPVDYIAGKMMLVRALVSELDLLLLEPGGNPASSLTSDISFAAMVPLQAENMLVELETVESEATIRDVLLGGADVSPTLLERIGKQKTTQYYIGYGMTETCSHIALRRLGQAASEYYTSLDGVILAKDDRGCLVVDDTSITGQILTTNDLIEFDNNTCNRFRWLGRWDTVINSGGIKFSPEELEKQISHLFQNRFLISSAPDERLGGKIILVIEESTVEFSNLQSKEEIRERISAVLPKHAVPKKIIYVKKLETTPGNKIDRNYKYR